MKLCPIFLFPSSFPPTIPKPHCVPYGLDTLPQHLPLVFSFSTSPSTVISLPFSVPPKRQCVPWPVPRDEGVTGWPVSISCLASWQPNLSADNCWIRLLPLSSSLRKSSAQHSLASLFALQMLLVAVSYKLTYLRAAVGKTCLPQSSVDSRNDEGWGRWNLRQYRFKSVLFSLQRWTTGSEFLYLLFPKKSCKKSSDSELSKRALISATDSWKSSSSL